MIRRSPVEDPRRSPVWAVEDAQDGDAVCVSDLSPTSDLLGKEANQLWHPADRRTIPIPALMPELHHAAAVHFNHGGYMRLYHKGREMHQNVNDLKNDDVVDVKLVRTGVTPRDGMGKMVSTFKADFVQHPDTPRSPDYTEGPSCLSEISRGQAQDGKSRFTMDYNWPDDGKHRADVVDHKLLSSHWLATSGTHEAWGRTSYRDGFTPRTLDKNGLKQAPEAKGSVLSDESKGHAFCGKSRYVEDYTKTKEKKPPLIKCPKNESVLTAAVVKEAFKGSSSYKDHYKLKDGGPSESQRPKSWIPPYRPFDGRSEYQRRYEKEDVGHMTPRVHLQRCFT